MSAPAQPLPAVAISNAAAVAPVSRSATSKADSTNSTLSTPTQPHVEPHPTTKPANPAANHSTNSTLSTPASPPVERQSDTAAFLHQLPEFARLELPPGMPTPTPRDLTDDRKAKVLVATAAGANLHLAARAAGVHRTTLYVWQKEDPEFAAALRNAREARSQEAIEGIHQLHHQALSTLSQTLNDPSVSPALRLRAAIFILNTTTAAAPKPSRHADLEFSRVLLDQMFANPYRTAIEEATSQDTNLEVEQTSTEEPPAHEAGAGNFQADAKTTGAYAQDTGAARRDQRATRHESPVISTSTAVTPQTTRAQHSTARNAPCPCHSGLKYKRCCGKNAPMVLNAA